MFTLYVNGVPVNQASFDQVRLRELRDRLVRLIGKELNVNPDCVEVFFFDDHCTWTNGKNVSATFKLANSVHSHGILYDVTQKVADMLRDHFRADVVRAHYEMISPDQCTVALSPSFVPPADFVV